MQLTHPLCRKPTPICSITEMAFLLTSPLLLNTTTFICCTSVSFDHTRRIQRDNRLCSTTLGICSSLCYPSMREMHQKQSRCQMFLSVCDHMVLLIYNLFTARYSLNNSSQWLTLHVSYLLYDRCTSLTFMQL